VATASLTGVGITDSSPLAIARHADAEGPQPGDISAVAGGTPLAELAPVPRRALAAFHPGSGDSGRGLRRHQGDVVDVAGAWRETQLVTRGGQQQKQGEANLAGSAPTYCTPQRWLGSRELSGFPAACDIQSDSASGSTCCSVARPVCP